MVCTATSFIPKTGVEDSRRATYDRAFIKAQAREPALTWSNWIRRSLDEAARRELDLRGCQMCAALKLAARSRG